MPTPRDRLNKVMGGIHTRLFRLTDGKVGGRVGKAPVLLLTTTGRKSGQPRTRPLMYVTDGDDYVVAASNAGQDHPPAWFANLRADPTAAAEVAGRSVPVRAEVLDADEAAALWPRLDAVYQGYATYRRRTDRAIPLVRLVTRRG